MTTQSVSAICKGRSGKIYTFENTSVTDGTTFVELQSGPSPYSLTAQSLGDYAQNDIITHALVTAQTNAGAAKIDFGGETVATVAVTAFGVTSTMKPLFRPLRIQPGMTLNVAVHVVATTQYYLAVETDSQSHVFAATSTGANTYNFTSVNTGQDVGRVIKGVIRSGYVTGPQDTTAAPAGSIFVNGAGQPLGFVPLSGSSKQQPCYSMGLNIAVDLNMRAQVVADA